jgi:glycosyltransferase involved in cell wall biosynthesis
MKVSVIVPSKKCKYLRYILASLRTQTIESFEIIIVVKDCDLKVIGELCREHFLKCIIVEQKEGYFTHALNLGKKEAKGDITIFTDDDTISLQKWIERYVKLHAMFRDVAGVSSRDIYINIRNLRLLPTPDDRPQVRLYRLFISSWLEQPLPLMRKYRFGVYITKKLNIAHGFYIPNKTCYSLPLRGANMSFKTSYIYDIWFPEHKLLKRAPGNEQYFALQLALKGLNTIYVPSNPVLHIAREESLSRTRDKTANVEKILMKALIKDLLRKYGFN